MNLNELFDRFNQMASVAFMIAELEGKETLDHVPNLAPVPALEAAQALSRLLAADMDALYSEAEETSTRSLHRLAEAKAAAEALASAGENLDPSKSRRVEMFWNLSYVVSRVFYDTRDKLAQDKGIFAAVKV